MNKDSQRKRFRDTFMLSGRVPPEAKGENYQYTVDLIRTL